VVDWGNLIVTKEKFGSSLYYCALVGLEVSSFGKAQGLLQWGWECQVSSLNLLGVRVDFDCRESKQSRVFHRAVSGQAACL
jgi:hypothetical protein